MNLTPREWDVLKCLAEGGSNKEIAVALGMSPQTVRNHLSLIYDKLNVDSRMEAFMWYWGHPLKGHPGPRPQQVAHERGNPCGFGS